MPYEFERYNTTMDLFRASKDLGAWARSFRTGPEFYWAVGAFVEGMPKEEQAMAWLAMRMDTAWYAARRPYYHMYSSIWNAAERLDIEKVSDDCLYEDFGPISVSCPLLRSPLLIQCFGYPDQGKRILGVLANEMDDIDRESAKKLDGCAAFPARIQYVFHDADRCGKIASHFTKLTDELDADAGPAGDGPAAKELLETHVRLFALLKLLANCEDIVERDVIASDLPTYRVASPEKRAKLEAKAAKRRDGQVGWTIGRELQEQIDCAEAFGGVAPHLRIPHLCLFHVGTGRTQQIVKLRSGSVIHPDQVGKLPTGYHDPPPEKKGPEA